MMSGDSIHTYIGGSMMSGDSMHIGVGEAQ